MVAMAYETLPYGMMKQLNSGLKIFEDLLSFLRVFLLGNQALVIYFLELDKSLFYAAAGWGGPGRRPICESAMVSESITFICASFPLD